MKTLKRTHSSSSIVPRPCKYQHAEDMLPIPIKLPTPLSDSEIRSLNLSFENISIENASFERVARAPNRMSGTSPRRYTYGHCPYIDDVSHPFAFCARMHSSALDFNLHPDPGNSTGVPLPALRYALPPEMGHLKPPLTADAELVLYDIDCLLHPPRTKGRGYKYPRHLPRYEQLCISGISILLRMYLDPRSEAVGASDASWTASSLRAAVAQGRGESWAKRLRRYTRRYITSRELPKDTFSHNKFSLLNNESFVQDLHVYLQGIGKYISSTDVVHYVDQDDVKEKFEYDGVISLATAQRWMHRLEFRWMRSPRGQYSTLR